MRKLVCAFAVLVWSLTSVAQQKTVSGKISDANNTPVAGATVAGEPDLAAATESFMAGSEDGGAAAAAADASASDPAPPSEAE